MGLNNIYVYRIVLLKTTKKDFEMSSSGIKNHEHISKHNFDKILLF